MGSVSHACLPGPIHTSPLYPRQSHPISASSKWSWRCGNSDLQPCRQRYMCLSCLFPRTQGGFPISQSPLLNNHSPQQEQYRFLYHTVAQLFSRTLQNTSPHYQNLKEVQESPIPLFLPVINTYMPLGNSNCLTVKGTFISSELPPSSGCVPS